MPRGEGVQTIKVAFANATMNKRKTFPLLPQIKFVVQDAVLVYLPFTETGHDMILQGTRISINKRALAYGRYL
jgi:hypothetical protein